MKNQTIEILYKAYLQDEAFHDEDRDNEVSEIGCTLDDLMDSIPEEEDAGTLIGQYEEAARRAGFYAGFKAAMGLFIKE